MPRRITRVLLVAVLSAPLAGCGGGMFGGGFDPTDLLGFLDTKKPLPGERKPVFPEGVPGVDRGVPPDMVRGSPGALAARQQVEQGMQPQVQPQPGEPAAGQQAAVAPPQAEEAPPPATRPPPPAARPKAPTKRRSVTAPPPDPEPAEQAQPAPQPQQAQPAPSSSPFPSPFSQPKQSGTFTR